MKGKWKRGLAIVFAIALVASAGVFSTDHFLKATDGEENILDFSESGDESAVVAEQAEIPAEEETLMTIEQGLFESEFAAESTAEEIASENPEEVSTSVDTAIVGEGELQKPDTGETNPSKPAEGEANTKYAEAELNPAKSADGELNTQSSAAKDSAVLEVKPAVSAEKSVVIAYDVVGGEFTGIGSQIKLTALLTGYEDPRYQWQYNDGSEWKDIDGATSSVYMLDVTEENSSYRWRVDVE